MRRTSSFPDTAAHRLREELAKVLLRPSPFEPRADRELYWRLPGLAA